MRRIKPFFSGMNVARPAAAANCDRRNSHRDRDVGIRGPHIRLRLDSEPAGHFKRSLHERQSQVVELRFFGGLSLEETAEVLTRISHRVRGVLTVPAVARGGFTVDEFEIDEKAVDWTYLRRLGCEIAAVTAPWNNFAHSSPCNLSATCGRLKSSVA